MAYPVVVIGAGAVGLAAAAHLLERGETPIVLERGASIAQNIREWAHVRLFSPWRYTLDGASVRLLKATGWQQPDLEAIPTGGELVEQYLKPLSELPLLRSHIKLGAKVTGVARQHADKMKDARQSPFVVRYENPDGTQEEVLARAVIDASGTWTTPNPMGANGLEALNERVLVSRVAYGIPDVKGASRERYANQRVLVVGSGHSAINALLDLAELQKSAPQTRILWALRKPNIESVYGGQENDELKERGRLGLRLKALVDDGKFEVFAPFLITRLQETQEGISVFGDTHEGVARIETDEIIVATGFRPDWSFARELRLGLDSSLETTPALAPLIDPNVHSCGTVPPHGEAELRHPEPEFYTVGMKSYGRAPTFLLATGYEQVRSVVSALVGDWQGAREVHLELPETGVCCADGDACSVPSRSVTLSLESLFGN